MSLGAMNTMVCTGFVDKVILSFSWGWFQDQKSGTTQSSTIGIPRTLEQRQWDKLDEENPGYGVLRWDSGPGFISSGEGAWGQRTGVDNSERLAIPGKQGVCECVCLLWLKFTGRLLLSVLTVSQDPLQLRDHLFLYPPSLLGTASHFLAD